MFLPLSCALNCGRSPRLIIFKLKNRKLGHGNFDFLTDCYEMLQIFTALAIYKPIYTLDDSIDCEVRAKVRGV